MKRTRFTNVVDALCLILMTACTVFLFAYWNVLPDRVPIHYGWTGKADGWTGREQAWILPCVLWGCFALMSVVERFPCLWNTGGIQITDENRDRIYALIRKLISTTKAFVVVLLSLVVVDATRGGGAVPPVVIAAFLPLVVGNGVFWLVKMFLNR